MDETARIFYTLSDKNRLRILMLLMSKTLCVCEITKILDISTSTVSNHLSILKNAGFIYDTKEGKWVNYSLDKETKNPRVRQILLMLPMWLSDDEQITSDLKRIEEADRNILCSV